MLNLFVCFIRFIYVVGIGWKMFKIIMIDKINLEFFGEIIERNLYLKVICILFKFL